MLAPARALEGTTLDDELSENGTRADITWIKDALAETRSDQRDMARQLGEVHSGVTHLRADGRQYSKDLGKLEGRVDRMSRRLRELETLRWKLIGACTAAGALTGGGVWLLFTKLLG